MEETVSCFCNGCSTELGQFRNAWNVIGHNYYSPVYPVLTYDDGFMGLGDVRSVKLGSHAACTLQDLKCKSCRVYLGVRCESAPNGHILKKNQYLLRLAEITTHVAGTNKKAQIVVKNTYILESADGKSKRAKSRAASVQPNRAKSMGAAAPRRESSVMAPPPPPMSKANRSLGITPAPEPRASSFEAWAEKEIRDQRAEISRISGVVDRVDATMSEFRVFMEEMRGYRATDQEKMKKALTKATSQSKSSITKLQSQIEQSEKTTEKTIEELKQSFKSQLDAETGRVGDLAQQFRQQVPADLQRLKGTIDSTYVPTLATHKEKIRTLVDSVHGHDGRIQASFRNLSFDLTAIRDRVAALETGQVYSAPTAQPPPAPSDPTTVKSAAASVERKAWSVAHYDISSRNLIGAASSAQAEDSQRSGDVSVYSMTKPAALPDTSQQAISSPIHPPSRVNGPQPTNDVATPAPILPPKSAIKLSKISTPAAILPPKSALKASSSFSSGTKKQLVKPAEKSEPVIDKQVQSSNKPTKRNSSLRVEVPRFVPGRKYTKVLSSPESSFADSNSSSDSDSSIESIPHLPRVKRKRPIPSDPGFGVEEAAKRQRTSRRNIAEDAVISNDESLPKLESPKSESSEERGDGSNVPTTSQVVSLKRLQTSPKKSLRKSKTQLQSEPIVATTVANQDVSMPKNVSHRAVSAYASSYHSSSNNNVPTSAMAKLLASKSNTTYRRSFQDEPAALHTPNNSKTQSPGVGPDHTLPRKGSILPSIERGYSEHLPRNVVNDAPTPEQIKSPYKCGGCDRRFQSAQGLKVHKVQMQECRSYTSRDSIPLDFICSGCHNNFSSLSHFNSHDCDSAKASEETSEVALPAKDVQIDPEAQKKILAKRDQLVRETLEREMGL